MQWWTKYSHIPFEEKGRTALGVDCWGLAKMIFNIEKQIDLPGYEEYYETTTEHEKITHAIERERQIKWQEVEKPQGFDFILLKEKNFPMHVGIVTKPGYMIHCARDIGTVHERYTSLRWQNKIAGFYRYEP